MRSVSSSSAVCHRCGKGGHLARDCSQHTCFRCNAKGHLAWECGEGVTCGRCGEKGHIQRNCKKISCHRCGRRGHIAKFCNDPFAKAAEMERQEQRQASSLARAGPGVSVSMFENTVKKSSMCGGSGKGSLVRQREASSPWDDLGVRKGSGGDGRGEPTTSVGRLKSGGNGAAFAVGGTGVIMRQVALSPSQNPPPVLISKRKGVTLGPRFSTLKKQRDDPLVEQGANVESGVLVDWPGTGGQVESTQLGETTSSALHNLDGYGSDDSGLCTTECDGKPGEGSNCSPNV